MTKPKSAQQRAMTSSEWSAWGMLAFAGIGLAKYDWLGWVFVVIGIGAVGIDTVRAIRRTEREKKR